ncbi:MAG: hypothetical protein K9N01_15600 [Cephaloticoccus sp.]|nr:hypothetical protein [Cephaloticoccus sp.]
MNFRQLLLVCGILSLGLGFARAETYSDPLLSQAEQEAPGEVQLHIIKTYGKLSNFIAKVREVEQVRGWQQIRVEGEAAFASWDNLRQDYAWNGGKFEVLFDIVESRKLKLNTVTFKGQSTQADR